MEKEQASISLKCKDCGTLSVTVEEAEKHVKITRHTNSFEVRDPILNLACSTCARLCRSKTEADLHIQRSGHEGFKEKTADDELLEKMEMVRKKHTSLANDAEHQMTILLVALQIPSRPELLRECLQLLKLKHKDDDAKVATALETLYTFVRNIALNPNDEKFRKIRVANVNFQNRVGKLAEGIDFLMYCGFESVLMDVSKFGGYYVEEFLSLPRNKVDMHVLGAAGTALKAASNQPFFGFS